MGWFRSLLILFVFCSVLAIGLLFTIANDRLVPLNILIAELPEQRLATWLLVAFFLGGILGMASALVALARLRAGKMRLQRRINQLESKQKPS